MSQTTGYGFELVEASRGQIADIGNARIDSFALDLTGLSLSNAEFGYAVARATDPEKQCKPITIIDDAFLGIIARTHTVENVYDSFKGAALNQGDMLSVLRSGAIYIKCFGECEAGAPVYIKIIDNFGEFVGALESAEPAIGPVGVFEGTLSAGDLDESGYGIVKITVIHKYHKEFIMDQLQKLHNDSEFTAFFARELEAKKAQAYDVLNATLNGFNLVPVSSTVSNGAESIVYEQYDQTGIAKVIANYADDLPQADVKGKEFFARVKGVGNSYSYSLQELRASMHVGKGLDQKKADAAVRAQQEVWNRILFYGDAENGLPGWLTNANIPQVAATLEAGDPSWFDNSGVLRKSAAQILADMNNLANSIPTLTNDTEKPTRFVMPVQHYNTAAVTQVSSGSDMTVLKFFLANNPYIKEVLPANELSAAQLTKYIPGVFTANKSIFIAYNPSPDKLTFEMPQPFEQFPAQQDGLKFTVPCHSRVAGTLVYYPLSMAIMKGI